MLRAITERTQRGASALITRPERSIPTIRVLLVEDEPLYARLIESKLDLATAAVMKTTHVLNLMDALNHLSTDTSDVVLLDLNLPECSGLETITRVREAAPDVPIVVLTGLGTEDLAVEALKTGAQDYLEKGADESLLVRSIRYAVERFRAQTELEVSQATLKSAQMQLMQIEKMDSIGRLAAGIAHEVRNPLAIIQMGIDFLRKFDADHGEEARETFEDMDVAVKRAYEIIKGLLDFCVPTDLDRQELSLNSCICQIMPMFRCEIRKRNINFTPRLSGDLPPLTVDKHKIQQALLNLILNSIDAMPDGGALMISTESRPLSAIGADMLPDRKDLDVENGLGIVVTIEDTGSGIPRAVAEHIFEPFFTTKPVGQATGLGLSITKNIIELHGARLRIVNRPEGGVRASITFAA